MAAAVTHRPFSEVDAAIVRQTFFSMGVLEAEMTEAVGAGKGEWTTSRLGYRSGYGACPRAGHWPDPWGRTLITRVGKLELRVPQDRDGRFSTELFESCRRSEQALVAALAEMYVQGVSISAINKKLDESLAPFASRRLGEPFPT